MLAGKPVALDARLLLVGVLLAGRSSVASTLDPLYADLAASSRASPEPAEQSQRRHAAEPQRAGGAGATGAAYSVQSIGPFVESSSLFVGRGARAALSAKAAESVVTPDPAVPLTDSDTQRGLALFKVGLAAEAAEAQSRAHR